jgi:hypothetical protein
MRRLYPLLALVALLLAQLACSDNGATDALRTTSQQRAVCAGQTNQTDACIIEVRK